MRCVLGALFLLGCGAAAETAGPPRAASEPAAAPHADVVASVSATPAVVAPHEPVELSGSVATIRIVLPPDGTHVHDCLFTLQSGQFSSWLCGSTPSSMSYPLSAITAEALLAPLVRVDDWGAPLAEGDPDASITIALYGEHTLARFGATLDDEPPARAAFRVAAMAAAQEGLALLRELAEACTGCADDEYCEEGWHCTTMGPDGKNCVRATTCERRLPATSRCTHHYECRSRACEGTTEAVGHCG